MRGSSAARAATVLSLIHICFYKTDYTITKPGRVSILIPSCDHSSDLRTCVESICRKSTYEDFEIIVIENNSREPATFRCYERLQKEHRNLRVITWQGTGFNYSALNNFGAREEMCIRDSGCTGPHQRSAGGEDAVREGPA